MATSNSEVKKGLEGVLAGESTICLVDGAEGRLYYRGYSIFDLADRFTSEQVAYLLLYGELPGEAQLKEFNDKLLRYRRHNKKIVDIIKSLSRETHPMKVLQSTLAALGGIWDNKDGMSAQETFIAYISQIPLIVAAHWRIMSGREILEPRKDLSWAGNFLYMLDGEEPTELQTRVFDTALILHMEHGFNASTFSARVVASSMASVSASLSAAVGSLSGPLHGGANERVLEMLEGFESVDEVPAFIDEKLAGKGKVMGMGHRVYRQKDPRAIILQKHLAQVATDDEAKRRLEILEAVEDYMGARMKEKGKDIYANVDFYSGTLFSSLGINQLLFTPIFAMARIVGWSAHIGEQWEDNRIFRPKCLYVGDVDRPLAISEEAPEAREPGPRSILIIDDDVDLIEAIQIPLEANEYAVSFGTTHKNAVELVRKVKPDLILLDVMFPGAPTAGFDICRQLKSGGDTADIPVVILSAINQKFDTAFSAQITRSEYESIPADRFLEKPVNPQILLGTIADVLAE